MKFDAYDHKIVIDLHIIFHEDLSFRCGDICKTILVFLIVDFQCIFHIYPIVHLHSLRRWILILNNSECFLETVNSRGTPFRSNRICGEKFNINPYIMFDFKFHLPLKETTLENRSFRLSANQN